MLRLLLRLLRLRRLCVLWLLWVLRLLWLLRPSSGCRPSHGHGDADVRLLSIVCGRPGAHGATVDAAGDPLVGHGRTC